MVEKRESLTPKWLSLTLMAAVWSGGWGLLAWHRRKPSHVMGVKITTLRKNPAFK